MSELRGLLHRRWHSIVGTLLVVCSIAIIAWGTEPSTTSGPLDPDNPHPDGARALSQVLGQHGVDVEVVRSADEFDASDVAGATVLVTATDALGRSTVRRLQDHSGGAQVVIAAPNPGVTRALGVSGGTPVGLVTTSAACTTTTLPFDGLRVSVVAGVSYPGSGCFPAPGGGRLVTEPRPDLILLGAADVLTNEHIREADNAAVALRLLGRHDRLIWYVANLGDLGSADGVTLASLLPPWLAPALWLIGLTMVAVIIWRARRLGPLAVEPLPVSVKAIETTHSRGRLYRKAGDRAHAAAALRFAARERLRRRLHLPATAGDEVIADAVAARVPTPAADLRVLIDPSSPTPAGDRELIDLAHRLAALDEQMGHSP